MLVRPRMSLSIYNRLLGFWYFVSLRSLHEWSRTFVLIQQKIKLSGKVCVSYRMHVYMIYTPRKDQCMNMQLEKWEIVQQIGDFFNIYLKYLRGRNIYSYVMPKIPGKMRNSTSNRKFLEHISEISKREIYLQL